MRKMKTTSAVRVERKEKNYMPLKTGVRICAFAPVGYKLNNDNKLAKCFFRE